MILSKDWWKRRAGRTKPEGAVALDFFAVALESTCEHGTYYVERVSPDWSVRFRPQAARADARDMAVDARDDEGNPRDWPTRGSAEDACRLHAHLLELGHSVARATELVAQRSQRISQPERVETLDYAQPVAARR